MGIKKIFHFLGGVHLAIFLIAVSALAVIAGTFIESKTGSHLYAARWTYENAFFLGLLTLFFINILFAALRRWPFKKRHIPFLITHLGLLMVIAGTMIKNKFGTQGQLVVWEGSGSQHLILPHTHSLWIEKKSDPLNPRFSQVNLDTLRPSIYYPFHFPQLKLKVIGSTPHARQTMDTWIKGSHAYIAGFPPIPVYEWNASQPFPETTSYNYSLATYFNDWNILAIRSDQLHPALQNAYLQELTLILTSKKNKEEILRIPLSTALQQPFSFAGKTISIRLNIPTTMIDDESTLSLQILIKSETQTQPDNFFIPLRGQDALRIKSEKSYWMDPCFTVDLVRTKPLLFLIGDHAGDCRFFAFDPHGRIHFEQFVASHLKTMIAYDQGFGGYGVQTVVPIALFPTGRKEKENAEAEELIHTLKEALVHHPELSPPLKMMKQACERSALDFAETCVQFLVDWNAESEVIYHGTHLVKLAVMAEKLDWDSVPPDDRHAIAWTYKLLTQLNHSIQQGEDIWDLLQKHQWPLLEQLRQSASLSSVQTLPTLLAQQIASLVHYLPKLEFPTVKGPMMHLALLSAYFRAYGIDYQTLFPYRVDGNENFDLIAKDWKKKTGNIELKQAMVFEAPLTQKIEPQDAPIMLEECCPGLVLEVQEGLESEKIALGYDFSVAGMKWPILNGKYALRFQPVQQELPYRVRLRQARQVYYPQSQQVYSYEADVLITEKGKSAVEYTLSMNQVYETWDGYRFYLSGIGGDSGGNSFVDEKGLGLKRIQLAVNHDPAKYYLTYPGALLVFLGIILLFWKANITKLVRPSRPE